MNTASPPESQPVTSENLRAQTSAPTPTRVQVAAAIRAGHVPINGAPQSSRAERRRVAQRYLRGHGTLTPASAPQG